MENVNITLELTLQETNMILDTLGKHPFESVVQLIGKIRLQGEAQIAALQEAEAVEVSEEV